MARKSSPATARNITAASNEPTVKQIGGSTQVIFTMKSFFALMSTILGLFFGFYMLVINPRINKTEQNYENMYKEQRELNATFTKEITDIKLNMKTTSQNTNQAVSVPAKETENSGTKVATIDSSR